VTFISFKSIKAFFCKNNILIFQRNSKINQPTRSFKKKFVNLATSSTFHGIAKILHAKKLLRKLYWLAILLAFGIICSHNISMSILNYYTYPVVTNFVEKTPRRLQFPAVTICNTDQFLSIEKCFCTGCFKKKLGF